MVIIVYILSLFMNFSFSIEHQETPKTFAEKPLDCKIITTTSPQLRKLSRTLCQYYNHTIKILPFLEGNTFFHKPRSLKVFSSEIATLIPRQTALFRGLSASSVKLFTYPGFRIMSWDEFLAIFATAKQNTQTDPNYIYDVNKQPVTLPGLLKTAIANAATNYLQAPDQSIPSPPSQDDIIQGMKVLEEQFKRAFKQLPKEYRPTPIKDDEETSQKPVPLTVSFKSLVAMIGKYLQKNNLSTIQIAPFNPTVNIDPPYAVNLRHINDENFWFKSLVKKKIKFTLNDYQTLINDIALNYLVPSQFQHYTDPFHWIVLAKMYIIWHADFKTSPKHQRLDHIQDKDPYIGYIEVITPEENIKRKSLVDVLYDAMILIDQRSQKEKTAQNIAVHVTANLNKAIANFEALIKE